MSWSKGDVVRLSLPTQRLLYQAGCAEGVECWEVLHAHDDQLTLTPVLSESFKLAFIRIKATAGSVQKVRVVE